MHRAGLNSGKLTFTTFKTLHIHSTIILVFIIYLFIIIFFVTNVFVGSHSEETYCRFVIHMMSLVSILWLRRWRRRWWVKYGAAWCDLVTYVDATSDLTARTTKHFPFLFCTHTICISWDTHLGISGKIYFCVGLLLIGKMSHVTCFKIIIVDIIFAYTYRTDLSTNSTHTQIKSFSLEQDFGKICHVTCLIKKLYTAVMRMMGWWQ